MKEIETVKGIIKKRNKNKFLLMKIKDSEIWQFVTGKIEEKESEFEALVREINEEVGVSRNEIININKMNFKDVFTQDNCRIKSTIFPLKLEM